MKKFKLLADYDLVIRLILNNYKGIYFESNVVTYKLGEQITKFGVQSEAECNHIFYKIINRCILFLMRLLTEWLKFPEIPKPLLDKLATRFPAEDRQLFYERYEEMYNMRVEAQNSMRDQNRRR